MFDRKAFFAGVRTPVFRGHMTSEQVSGCEAIIAEAERRSLSDVNQLGYILATPWWETDHTMQPIKEKGSAAYFTRMYDIRGERPWIARELGNLHPGDGARFCGRGLAQNTGRGNYGWASTVIGQDCVANPDLLLEPQWACKVLFEAMFGGKYTGAKLATFVRPGHVDFVGARRVINGTDQALTIASAARHFAAALHVVPTPAPAPAPQPAPAPAVAPHPATA